MVRYSHELRSNTPIPMTSLGTAVIHPFFDSNLNVPPVPDHCVTGVIKNLLVCWFLHFETDKERASCEIKILHSLSQNGLPGTSNVLKWDKHGKFVSVENISMTSLYTILFVASNVLQNDPAYYTNPLTNLFVQLDKVVSTMFFFPLETDSDETSQQTTLDNYYGKLQDDAQLYIRNCAEFHRLNPRLSSPLDKPNIHRLLELCYHTFPHYGHEFHVSELVLEMAHRNFKTWIEKNRNSLSHLSAVERSLCEDRLNRIYILLHDAFTDSYSSQHSKVCLRKLFLGDKASFLDSSNPRDAVFLEDVDETLRSFLQQPFQKQLLGGSDTEFFDVHGKRVWKAVHNISENTISSELQLEIDQLSKNIQHSSTTFSTSSPRLVRTASLVYESTITQPHLSSKTYSHHTIFSSTAIVANITDSQLDSSIIFPSYKSIQTRPFFSWFVIYLSWIRKSGH